jgi:hypothetical protein
VGQFSSACGASAQSNFRDRWFAHNTSYAYIKDRVNESEILSEILLLKVLKRY